MTTYPMENEEKAALLIELVKKARAGMPPRPHEVRTPEHGQECIECREWSRALEASFEKIETEEGKMSGELGILMRGIPALATRQIAFDQVLMRKSWIRQHNSAKLFLITETI